MEWIALNSTLHIAGRSADCFPAEARSIRPWPCTAPGPVLEPDVKVSGLQLIVGHRILAFVGTAFTVSLCASYLGPPAISCSRAGEQLCVTLCHACGCAHHTVPRSASSQGEGDGVSIGLRCTAITPAGRMHLYGAPVSVSKIQ
jgi:hypothetical protein